MNLGIHAPLRPANTGVADYVVALVEALRGSFDVVLNPRHRLDRTLYHVGNNQLHAAIYRRALAEPAPVVLHDAVLHHFFLGLLDESGYVDEFCYNYGNWYRDLARELWRKRSRSAQDPRYFRYPMLRRIAERAPLIVVHNPAAAAMVSEAHPGARVVEIPHLFSPTVLPEQREVERLRTRLGVQPSTTLFGVFGYLRETKRLATVLRAFKKHDADAALLVAGDFTSPELERSMSALLDAPGVIRVPYLDEQDFWLYACATDVCINLRHPAAGETSGIAIRMMGIGKAVIVTSGDENARIPEHCCVRVDPGPDEEPMLEASMRWLTEDPGSAREIGSRAAAHIAANHSLEHCAALYADALANCTSSV